MEGSKSRILREAWHIAHPYWFFGYVPRPWWLFPHASFGDRSHLRGHRRMAAI